jgi:hypothetical protein
VGCVRELCVVVCVCPCEKNNVRNYYFDFLTVAHKHRAYAPI